MRHSAGVSHPPHLRHCHQGVRPLEHPMEARWREAGRVGGQPNKSWAHYRRKGSRNVYGCAHGQAAIKQGGSRSCLPVEELVGEVRHNPVVACARVQHLSGGTAARSGTRIGSSWSEKADAGQCAALRLAVCALRLAAQLITASIALTPSPPYCPHPALVPCRCPLPLPPARPHLAVHEPAAVRPEEALVGGVRVQRTVGVAVVEAVVAHPRDGVL